MNIFVLDHDPILAASYHCDQHIHKMILESAQMLSTAAHKWYPWLGNNIYKPSYPNHPCTQWVCTSKSNAYWVIVLCEELAKIRDQLNCTEHSSMGVIKTIQDHIEFDFDSYTDDLDNIPQPENFVFAGPPGIRIRTNLSLPEKYQAYYRIKQRDWLDTRNRMSYKGRSLPPFLTDLSSEILHG
jgi:hypothetical protein